MKKIYTLFAVLFISASVFGQAPASFKYQAVLRDARGNVRANTSTSIIISILSGSATGNAVYSETHSVKTDGYGLVNLEIGNGTATLGTMSAIDWSNGTYFIKTTVDGIVMGTNQLLSVPFAQYANRAANGLSQADSTKLAGIAPGAEVNVNADWNAESGDAQILNKPTIVNPVNADWNATSGTAQILNKPAIVNPVNADWNATSGAAQILNKPTVPTVDGSETKVNPGTNVTVTGTGTSGNPYVISTATHTLGEEYQGGIIFYVYDGGQHGLIAAKQDLFSGEGQYSISTFSWFNLSYYWDGESSYYYYYMSTGAKSDGLGAGKMNTSLIILSQTIYNYQYESSSNDFAAKLCVDYSASDVNEIMYGDWYLPSRYELDLLQKSQENVPTLNLSTEYYWSSTEADDANAWFQDFSSGDQVSIYGSGSKSDIVAHVRPIRSF